MSGRTKLYQKAGSPLIQGNSRITLPFWRVWLGGVAVGFLIAVLVWVLVQWFLLPEEGTLAFSDVALAAVLWAGVMGLPGLLLGAAFGAWLARNMGWSRTSVSAGVIAAIFSVVSTYIGLFILGVSLTSRV